MYKPNNEMMNGTGLSINFHGSKGLANQERIPTTATGVSQSSKLGGRQGQSKISLYPRQTHPEDEEWAQVANFNKLLDIKQKLDEASENKRKADMQRAYLDQQIHLKASQNQTAQREKAMQHHRMQNLIKQVAKDKTDSKNKDTLRRMKERVSRLNAVNNEKRMKDENIQMERLERE